MRGQISKTVFGPLKGNELHALSNHVFACVVDQQMYMVGRDDVVEDTKSKALLSLRVLALNVLNGAKRLNGLNVLNWLQS